MSNIPHKKSNKVLIVDVNTFENYKNATAAGASHKTPGLLIRNAKYKKTTKIGYSLLDFLTQRPKQKLSDREDQRPSASKAIYGVKSNTITKRRRGKQREGGRKKHYSRLKKSILRYRQQQQSEHQLLQDVTEQMCILQLDSNLTNVTKDEKEAVTIIKPPPLERKADVKGNGIHSRRFRDYCDNCTTELICKLTQSLLRDLNRFQRRAYAQNEIKARAHRRFVIGFREIQNFMLIDKVKILFIATDLEICEGEDGLDATIAKLKTQCQKKQVPYIFSLTRREISYALYKKVPISCVGILDYDGARDTVAELEEELKVARENYQILLLQKQQQQQQQQE